MCSLVAMVIFDQSPLCIYCWFFPWVCSSVKLWVPRTIPCYSLCMLHYVLRAFHHSYPMCFILTCSVVITRYFPLYVPLRPPCIHALPYVYRTNLFYRDYPYDLCVPSSSNSQTNPGPTLNLGWNVPLGWRPLVCKTSSCVPPS